MATDINKVIVIGRLTKDPVLQSTSTGRNFSRISIANNRTYKTKDDQFKEEVNFFDCVAWGKTAETICKYLQKGRRIGIEGTLRFSSWENTEGKKQSKVEINIDTFQFLDSKSSSDTYPSTSANESANTGSTNPAQNQNNKEEADPFQKIDSESISDDDIPF